VPGHWAVCQGCNLAAKLTVDDCVATLSPTSAPTTYESTQGMGGGGNSADDRTDDHDDHSNQQDDTTTPALEEEDDHDDHDDHSNQQDNGMGDEEDGIGDEDGMGDEEDGMDRMRRRRSSSSAESYNRPRWYTCADQRYWEARPTTTLRANIRILDQSEGAAPAKTRWQKFVDNKPALGFAVLALVTVIVGGAYVGAMRYRRHKQYPSGWKRLKTKLNQYGAAADDPFDGWPAFVAAYRHSGIVVVTQC
jgi:hypothetical protein